MKTKKLKAKHSSRPLARLVSGRGWAWLCDFGLCHWAQPDHERLKADGRKPSPEAKAVAVRIILEKDYRRLISANAALCDPAHGDAGKPKPYE